MGKTKNWALDGAMEHLGPSDYAMGKLGPPNELVEIFGALNHEFFSTV